MKARPLAAVASLVLAIAAPAAGALDGFRYTRSVQVDEAGWVRLPLDLDTLRHAGPGLADLRLFDAAGEEVPLVIEPFEPKHGSRPARVIGVETAGGEIRVDLDLGPRPPRHGALVFAFLGHLSAPAVTLEGSADRKSWHPLAAADLFRLGGRADLERRRLPYPPSDLRYLRLHWPASAGLPHLEGAEVETVEGPTVEVVEYRVSCERRAPGEADCRLPLGVRRQVVRRLAVDVEAAGAVGYRLYRPEDGRWIEMCSGVWRGGSEADRVRRVLEPPAVPVAGDRLRLELATTGDPAPRVAGFRAEIGVHVASFRARTPGVYTLVYGGPADGRVRTARGTSTNAAWVAAGAEEERPWQRLPEALTAPSVTLPQARFHRAYRVSAAGVVAGDLARLVLPDEVYPEARADLGDLRLAAGSRQIPFVLTPLEEPATVARGDRRTSEGGDRSEVELTVPVLGLPVTQLLLTAPSMPFTRQVAAIWRTSGDSSAGLQGPGERPAAVGSWSCGGEAPLPCRFDAVLRGAPGDRLRVTVADGDNPPLPRLEAELLRRRHAVYFVWPDGGPVRLLVGAGKLAAPRYDLAALAAQLPLRPWKEVALGPAETGVAGSERSRLLLTASLALAALVLLALLARVLRG